MSSEPLPNIHPGDVLLNEFLKPMGVSQNKLARAMEVSPRRVNEIVNGKRSITANSALRLAKHWELLKNFGWAYRMIMILRSLILNLSRQFHIYPLLQLDVTLYH